MSEQSTTPSAGSHPGTVIAVDRRQARPVGPLVAARTALTRGWQEWRSGEPPHEVMRHARLHPPIIREMNLRLREGQAFSTLEQATLAFHEFVTLPEGLHGAARDRFWDECGDYMRAEITRRQQAGEAFSVLEALLVRYSGLDDFSVAHRPGRAR